MGAIPGMMSHSAWVVRSVREGSKVRQERLANLGTHYTRDGSVCDREGCVGDRYATEYWSHVRDVLDGLELTDHDRQKLLASIEDVLEALRLRGPRDALDMGRRMSHGHTLATLNTAMQTSPVKNAPVATRSL